MPPKVSVFMMAYNHKPYIAQALDSILSQDTDFSVEIVVGEDCSTDGTREIVEEYAVRYPTQIKALLHKTNVGASRNQIVVLDACAGDYIAICEGDDYWLDPLKLQKQVDFMELNRDYAICFSKAYELNGNNYTLASINPWNEEKTFDIKDLALGNFMHSPSVLFRNGLIKSFPIWFIKSPVGDYVIHMLNAKEGLIRYFPEPMVVYRKFTGTWSGMSSANQIVKFVNVIEYLLTENFTNDIIVLLKKHKFNLLTSYYTSMLNENKFDYLKSLDNELTDESDFIREWMLSIYPKKLQSIYNSRTYKFSLFFSNLKSKLWFK